MDRLTWYYYTTGRSQKTRPIPFQNALPEIGILFRPPGAGGQEKRLMRKFGFDPSCEFGKAVTASMQAGWEKR
jgi:hypothetical protein